YAFGDRWVMGFGEREGSPTGRAKCPSCPWGNTMRPSGALYRGAPRPGRDATGGKTVCRRQRHFSPLPSYALWYGEPQAYPGPLARNIEPLIRCLYYKAQLALLSAALPLLSEKKD